MHADLSYRAAGSLSYLPRTFILGCFALTLLFMSGGAAAQSISCPSEVILQGAEIRVSASGGDDTFNLQCAIDEAIALSIPSIKLSAGVFNISQVEFQRYSGQFAGVSKSATVVNIIDNSISCELGAPTFAFSVLGGDIKIERMGLVSNEPCSSGDTFFMLSFRQVACDERTMFVALDRLDISGNSPPSGLDAAVAVGNNGACDPQTEGPLGTFKLNRSEIRGFRVGVFTAMRGAAQVDINFNTIEDVSLAIRIEDANQSTTITGNNITFNDRATDETFITGLGVLTRSGTSPDANRTVVHSNTFVDANVAAEATAVAVSVDNFAVRASHSVVITGNRFTGGSVSSFPVAIRDVDSGIIQDNRFSGSANCSIIADSVFFPDPTQGWGVLANNFDNASAFFADICLETGTSNWVVDPAGGTVLDSGQNTIIGTSG